MFLDLSAVNSDLAEALKSEINAEKQLEAENLGGAKAPAIPGFTITTNDAEVRLTKTHGNEKLVDFAFIIIINYGLVSACFNDSLSPTAKCSDL